MSYYISFKVINKDSGKVLFERVCNSSSVPYQMIIESLDFLYSSLPHLVIVTYEKLDRI